MLTGRLTPGVWDMPNMGHAGADATLTTYLLCGCWLVGRSLHCASTGLSASVRTRIAWMQSRHVTVTPLWMMSFFVIVGMFLELVEKACVSHDMTAFGSIIYVFK